MLKLMKYEFIHSMRTFLLSFIIFLGVCFVYPFLTIDVFNDYAEMTAGRSLIFILLNFSFIFLIIGILIALDISVVLNFHRSMFKRPAYLSLTLPVSTTQLILSKVIVSVIWLLIGMVVLMFGVFSSFLLTGYLQSDMSIGLVTETLRSFSLDVSNAISSNISLFLSDLLFIFGELIFGVGSIYLSMSAVHTKWCRKYRTFFGIVLFILMNIGMGFVLAKVIPSPMMETEAYISCVNGICQTIVGSLMIFITIYLFNHHVEID